MEAVGVKADHNGHVSAKVNGTLVNFLVDTGATISLLNFFVPQLSRENIKVDGVVGGKELRLSLPLPVVLGGKMAWGKFVVSPETPVSLLGRDLLQEFVSCISLTPTGIQLIVIGMSLIKIPENIKEEKRSLRNSLIFLMNYGALLEMK